MTASPRLALLASLLDLPIHRSLGHLSSHFVFRGSMRSLHAKLSKFGVHHDFLDDEDGPAVGLIGLRVYAGGMGGVQVEDIEGHDTDPGAIHYDQPKGESMADIQARNPRMADLAKLAEHPSADGADLDADPADMFRVAGVPENPPTFPTTSLYAIAPRIPRTHESTSYAGRAAVQGWEAACRWADDMGRDADRP